MVSAYVKQEAAKLATEWGGHIEARPPLFPAVDRLLFGERRYVAGVCAASGDLTVYIRPPRVKRLWQRIKTLVLGRRYAGPHDHTVLRYRYSLYRGQTFWHRKWRVFGLVLLVKRINEKTSWRVSRVADEHDYYWRFRSEHPFNAHWAGINPYPQSYIQDGTLPIPERPRWRRWF